MTLLKCKRVLPAAAFAVFPVVFLVVFPIIFLAAAPAMAHHPFGGQAPGTIVEGLLSGVGHPVIGLDHLAFVIAVGLLAAVVKRGFTVPLAFLLSALVGTGLHLAEVTLPAPELVISLSVLVVGALVTAKRALNTQIIVLLTALVGMFHGYAYGEAVVGAEPTTLVAYLIGFTVVQGAIAAVAYLLSKRALNADKRVGNSAGLISVHHAGFAIFGAGAAFLGNLLV
ncbi:MAG: HupE/UreJ family protein [Cyanobacteria bacterium J06635_11]